MPAGGDAEPAVAEQLQVEHRVLGPATPATRTAPDDRRRAANAASVAVDVQPWCGPSMIP